MAIEQPIQLIPGAIAGASFATTGQHRFVKMRVDNPDTPGTDFTFTVCSATSDNPVGVAQNNPASGGALGVMVKGVTKVYAGGTIKAGQLVGTDANGAAVVIAETSSGAGYGRFVRGTALQDAASGDLFAMLLMPYYRVH